MLRCPLCAVEISGESLSCPSCGAALDASLVPTRVRAGDSPGAAGRKSPAGAVHTSLSSDSIDDARFVPGTVLGRRYRIVGLLGRGGMGEVYRAEDLTLKQTVALKFLPESVTGDAAALERFRREVRVARQISHPNVCRVYDIAEAEGLHFLSMEFIRGEELASVLKRFGRLPADKAVAVARQICAGVAAAHKGGVLHRDLKPANVMIDEAGDARVTDFGLAALAEEVRGDETAGTPAYMSPEQLAGRELTVRSDIYSLGLVLYELFTGRRAFDARTLPELLRLRQSDAAPTSPSSLVKDLDPLVERVVLRCLERDPEKRPGSALEVAAALPGGDPLAAALALGETPTPEMVAAAPKEGVLRPAVAFALLGAFVVGLALTCLLTRGAALYRMTPLSKSPDVMRVRAQEITRRLGYAEEPLDSAAGMFVDEPYLKYVADHDPSPSRWERLKTGQPSVYYFWYRQSPRYLFLPSGDDAGYTEPAWDVSGMTGVILDSEGRLRRFNAVPPRLEAPRAPAASGGPANAAPFDWSPLFAEAGLDPSTFRPAKSVWTPPTEADERAAWDGSYPAQPDAQVHVEAAAYRGRAVYFEVIHPWDRSGRDEYTGRPSQQRAVLMVVFAAFLLTLVAGVLLAVRNLRLGRGDHRGALRLAVVIVSARLLGGWAFGAHHFASPLEELLLFVEYLKSALFAGAVVWLLYIALEPFVRRRWPERIISWSRLVAGDFADPLVGRDMLVGAVGAVAVYVCAHLAYHAPKWQGRAPGVPLYPDARIYGASPFLGYFSHQIVMPVFFSLIMLMLMFLLYVVTRRAWLAGALAFLVLLPVEFLSFGVAAPLAVPFVFVLALIEVGVLYRFGLLALVSLSFVSHLWVFFPVTTELSAWYAGGFVLDALVCLALAAYGFYTSLGGQKLFRADLLGD